MDQQKVKYADNLAKKIKEPTVGSEYVGNVVTHDVENIKTKSEMQNSYDTKPAHTHSRYRSLSLCGSS